MSRTNNKLFCKICFDAKKPEQQYTSHVIKTRDGDVCCPILKATECRYCHKTGHTLAHCELRNKNNSASDKPIEKKSAPAPAPAPVKTPANKFALLDDDSDSDSDAPAAAPAAPAAPAALEPQNRRFSNTSYHKKPTVCERPLNQIFKIVDLSYLAEERARLGIVDPALGLNYAAAVAAPKKPATVADNYNRPDAPRGQDCFYTSEAEMLAHRAQMLADHLRKPTFASADEEW